MTDIISPLPGIFYRSPGPGKEPYALEGDAVSPGQVIGVVEIMKQFSEIRCEVAGVLERFHVADTGTIHPGAVIATVREE